MSRNRLGQFQKRMIGELLVKQFLSYRTVYDMLFPEGNVAESYMTPYMARMERRGIIRRGVGGYCQGKKFGIVSKKCVDVNFKKR